MDVVNDYSRTALAPMLRACCTNEGQQRQIAADVETRLRSLLLHWSDERFRRPLMTMVVEEATYWEPQDASLEIRCLVLMGVRNSLLEVLNASDHAGRQLLPDEDMPHVTADAVRYFAGADLAADVTQPKFDIFGSLPRRFPNAWRSLETLANAPAREARWQLQPRAAERVRRTAPAPSERGARAVATSGIDPNFDPLLASQLAGIQRGEYRVLYSDSLKSLTRNPEKLLAILDHVVRHRATLITANQIFAPDYVARRVPFIRPGHSTREFSANLRNCDGLTGRHLQLWRRTAEEAGP